MVCDVYFSFANFIKGIVCICKVFLKELKVVSATFLLVCFVCLKESTCETKKTVFYFTLKALFVLEVIKF